ncbi:hypothetical protein [Flavitalea sp.]|nr:hypothetical protein [Flavitalea sp.]
MNLEPVLLRRSEIDEVKWNQTVRGSKGAVIYGLTYSLDLLGGSWDALVAGDYRYILPLPYRKKFGIRYLYTPTFIQRLDVYGNDCNEEIRAMFLIALERHYSYADIDLAFSSPETDWSSRARVNYVLPLLEGYDLIAGAYQEEATKCLRKANSRHCRFTGNVPPNDVIALYRKTYGEKAACSDDDYGGMLSFAVDAGKSGNLLSCGVENKDTGELYFAAMFFVFEKRIYYLLGAPTVSGRTARAGYFMIDSIIRQYSGEDIVLDFEGSDIPGVATFYQKFSPQTEIYYHLHYNHLPFLFRWFKK